MVVTGTLRGLIRIKFWRIAGLFVALFPKFNLNDLTCIKSFFRNKLIVHALPLNHE